MTEHIGQTHEFVFVHCYLFGVEQGSFVGFMTCRVIIFNTPALAAESPYIIRRKSSFNGKAACRADQYSRSMTIFQNRAIRFYLFQMNLQNLM